MTALDLPEENEETPLLAAQVVQDPPSQDGKGLFSDKRTLRVVALVIISLFLIEVGDFMQRAPFTRILEDILCRSYYTTHAPAVGTNEWKTRWEPEIPEQDCKVADIQGKLAMLKGWDTCFSCIPSLLTAVPYGALSDRIGRKPVLLLSLFGICLSFMFQLSIAYFGRDTIDIRWTWLNAAFLLIGGGSTVALSMFFTMIADVVAADQRGIVFFQISAAMVLSSVVGVPLAWQLQKYSVWLPNVFSESIIILGSVVIFLMPETLDRSKFHEAALQHGELEELLREEEEEEAQVSFSKKSLATLLQRVEDSKFVFKNPVLCILAATFLVTRLGRLLVQSLLYQLASTRFNWSLAKASFLLPLNSLTTFGVLVILLPAIYALVKKARVSTTTRDLTTSRISILLLSLGSLGIAFSGLPVLLILSTIIFSLGCALPDANRSLLTSLVEPSQVSRLYGVLAVIETIGTLIAAPVFSKLFEEGMDIGGKWIGMAFIVAGAVYFVAGIGIWGIRVRGAETTPGEEA